MRRKKNQRPWVVILYDMIYDYIKLIFTIRVVCATF